MFVPPENGDRLSSAADDIDLVGSSMATSVPFADSSTPQVFVDPVLRRPRNPSPEPEVFRNDDEAIECSLQLIEKMDMSDNNCNNGNLCSGSNLKEALDGLMLDELSYGNPAIKVIVKNRIIDLKFWER